MATCYMRKNLTTLILAGVLIETLSRNVMAQECGCDSGLCCSQYGYCGTSDAYCGAGCQEGHCYTTNGVLVPDIVTDEFFNGLLDQADSNCAGKYFYSRDAFLEAHNSYSEFGGDNSVDDSKREIAALFANVAHEIGQLCYIEEINGALQDYCDWSNTQYPCNPNEKYYGRGPLQLSWNYNIYGAAGNDIGFDGINQPDAVATDPVISFKTALWFWMNNVHSVLGQGFGATINAINGDIECRENFDSVQHRVDYYTAYCNQLGVDPGDNLTC